MNITSKLSRKPWCATQAASVVTKGGGTLTKTAKLRREAMSGSEQTGLYANGVGKARWPSPQAPAQEETTMKHMAWRLVALMILAGALSAQGDQLGPYTYIVADSQATITGFDSGYTGDLLITNMLGGYPVTTIGNYAFFGCSGLTSVTIPNSVTTIGDSAFWGCSGLTAIEVSPDNSSYSSLGGVLFNKARTALLRYPEGKAGADYTILDSVTTIGDSAFWGCSGLTSVTIPNSVTTIGDSAFEDCTNLRRVYFTGNAPSLGFYVFSGTSATIYYLPGTTGWDDTYGEQPALFWNPRCQNLSVAGGVFTFAVTGTTNIPIAVEVSTNLTDWTRVLTTNLVDGYMWFEDPASTNAPRGFYRIAGW